MSRSIAAGLLSAAAVLAGCGGAAPLDGPAIALRAENLLVTPATGPVTHVLACNRGGRTWKGAIVATFPDRWRMDKTRQPVTLKPGECKRVPFAISRATDAKDNTYPIELKAVPASGGESVTWRGDVVVASAPYFTPAIDGDPADWTDAIPVPFATCGSKTVFRTYWSRRRLSLLVAVEEDALTPMSPGGTPCDAVQIALSPGNAKTPTTPRGQAQRHEFLLAMTANGSKGYRLMRPGDRVGAGQKPRALEPLIRSDVEVAVTRKGGTTYYECAIPFAELAPLKPAPGREFCLSVLVHDPDGTGLRDWGETAGLWAWQRNRLAWSTWPGAIWPDSPPFDNKIEHGFCSSKH